MQELQELEAAERIYHQSNSRFAPDAPAHEDRVVPQSERPIGLPASTGSGTIKQQIRIILGEVNPDGLSAQEILRTIRKRWTPSLERTSLSPQLSRLRRDGVIFNKNGVWYLY